MFFHAWPSGRDHIVGFVGGPAAWELARGGAAATEAFARAQLRGLLGADVDRSLGTAVATNWGTDAAYLGAYAYARTGHFAARAALGQPLADGRLIFAGEATRSDGLAGTVGGAYLARREPCLSQARRGRWSPRRPARRSGGRLRSRLASVLQPSPRAPATLLP